MKSDGPSPAWRAPAPGTCRWESVCEAGVRLDGTGVYMGGEQGLLSRQRGSRQHLVPAHGLQHSKTISNSQYQYRSISINTNIDQ